MRHAVVAAVLLVASTAGSAEAQQATFLVDSTADRAVEKPANGTLKIQLQAATDDSSATIKTGWNISSADPLVKTFSTFTLAASAPLASGGPTSFFGTDGFSDAFVVTGKFTRFLLATSGFKWDNPKLTAFCEAFKTKAREAVSAKAEGDRTFESFAIAMGKTPEEAERIAKATAARLGQQQVECDAGDVAEFDEDSLVEFERLMGLGSGWHRFWGVTGSVGYREFEFLKDDFTKDSVSRVPWGTSIFLAGIPPGGTTLMTFGFEFRRQHKAADQKTLCPPIAAAGNTECRTGIFQGPSEKDEKAFYFEVRHAYDSRALSLKIGYDIESDAFSVDAPFFLISNAEGGPAGGLRFGWKDGEGGRVGVFVTQAFSIFKG